MVSGAVLAGGKSKRFGEDKRFFKIGENTLLEIACEKIRKNFDKRYLAVDQNFSLEIPDFILVRDKICGKGPLIGIYSVLCSIEEDGCVFIPIDMPFLSDEIIKYISTFCEFDAVYLKYNETIYPLPGYYSKKIITLIEKQFELGDFSIKSLLLKIEGKMELNESKIAKFGNLSHLLLNVNDKSDLKFLKTNDGGK